MNICYVSEEFPIETQKGGIATYQFEIAKAMVRIGNSVHIICKTLSPSDRDEVYQGINLHYISYDNQIPNVESNTIYRQKVSKKMKQLEKSNNIDIFEVADWGAEAHFYILNRTRPVIIKLHTPYFIWKRYNKVDYNSLSALIEKQEIDDIYECDKVYACSESIKHLVSKELSIPHVDIDVIYNPIEIDNRKKCEKIDRSKILFVGSLEQRKGVLCLAEELNTFFKNNPSSSIVFAGNDTDRNKYKESTKKLIFEIIDERYHKNVEFIGQVDHDKLFNLFSSVNVAIFPSLYENFPYVLLEAMNSRCLSIGSVYGGMAEVIEDGVNGFLCRPDVKGEISSLLSKCLHLSEEERELIVDRSYSKLTQYRSSKIATETLNLYNQVIKGTPKNS